MSNQSSAGQKAARAASAAVNIARGAAAGGVYGAAVEAAKSFLPELIRLFVILLCVVLLVPMLVFTALPNILFGYSSSTDQEIIDFTASAQELDGIYQNLDNYQQPAVLRLVNSILPRFWSDGEPLYTMAVIFNAICESQSDLLLDPYLNSIGGAPAGSEKGGENQCF